MQSYIRLMDTVSRWAGAAGAWALLIACFISAGNATLRYAFSIGSNAWLEVQWYLFGFAVFAGAPMLLRLNEHVRVDVVYGGLRPRTKAWVDLLGILFVLLPTCCIVTWLAWPFVEAAYQQQEVSASAGGLIRWPIKLAVPAGFVLMALQGVSELFKRIAFLCGDNRFDQHYERPLQ
jgi:TRAP-type mannitol/chloroaromatic compound transport system permease small subunit